jgi:hypothetical protein
LRRVPREALRLAEEESEKVLVSQCTDFVVRRRYPRAISEVRKHTDDAVEKCIEALAPLGPWYIGPGLGELMQIIGKRESLAYGFTVGILPLD